LRTERLFNFTYMGVMCLYMNIIIALAYIRYYAPMLSFRSSPTTLHELRRLPSLFDAKENGRHEA